MTSTFLTGALASLAIAAPSDFNLDAYPVDLTPVPFITTVQLTNNKVDEYLPCLSVPPCVNPFN